MATVPTLLDVADRLGADPADDAFVSCYSAAVAQQRDRCSVEPYADDLAEALYRRVGNLWASRGHMFGLLDMGGDLGPSYIPRWDPVLDSLESPYRTVPIA